MAVLERTFVLEKCRRLIEFQVWPREISSRLEPWLSNFTAKEQACALQLLNSLTFLSAPVLEQMFMAAVQSLSSNIRQEGRKFVAERNAWNYFCCNSIVTIVQGEQPNITDSGHMFARICRDQIGFDQHDQILEPAFAVQRLRQHNQPLIFVDDFVGSGKQFTTNWKRRYDGVSFESLARERPGPFYYTPAVATAYGIRNIEAECANVKVIAGNTIPDRYSAIAADSMVWPPELQIAGPEFLNTASLRAGIPDTNGGEDDWRGFHKLALCFAMHHKVPDATLPIFTYSENGWHHLLRAPR